MIYINNFNDSRITQYKSLKEMPQSFHDEKLLIAEGEKVTVRLLKSRLKVISFFALPEYYERCANLLKAKNVPEESQYTASKTLMNMIVGFKLHTGIMAIAKQPSELPLSLMSDKIIVMNGIVDSENVGSLVRNASAFGVDSIICDKQTSSPYLRRAVRVSMGAVFDMKVHISNNILNSFLELKSAGYSIVAVELHKRAQDIDKFTFPEKCVLVFGSEGNGIAPALIRAADFVVRIPITDNVSSLNVASTSAIVCFQLSKQMF